MFISIRALATPLNAVFHFRFHHFIIFSDLPRKYFHDGRRFSDDCQYALCIRTLDRKVPNREVQYDRCSHFSDIGALCETCTGHPFVSGTCVKVTGQVGIEFE